jgi:UDP-GlcNAc:undecaprenyl-phosphate GlcNAc-1-phosphate transferase
MQLLISDPFLVVVIAIPIALICSKLSIIITKKFNIIDYPGRTSHNIHLNPTPLAGGIAIILSSSILALLTEMWTDSDFSKVIIPALIIFIFGLIDDIKGLNAFTKFSSQFIAVLILVCSGIRIQFLESNQFFITGLGKTGFYFDIFLTFLWIIGITNAFNLIDSMDGVSLGTGIICSAIFFYLSIPSRDPSLMIFTLTIIGLGLGIYYFNSPPARIFLGDSGSQLIGFIISIIAIIFSPIDINQNISWFTPIIIVGFPIFDTCLVFFSRLRRRTRFYEANLDHTYHRLVSMGIEQIKAITIIHLADICLGCIAIAVINLPLIAANIIFVLLILIGLGLVIIFDSQKFRKGINAIPTKKSISL